MNKLSIIIPMLNAEKTIEKCLDSILNQKEVSIEIICVNDNSDDNSCMLVSKYTKIHSNIHMISTESRKGSSHVKNVGMQAITGEYFTFVDSDDAVTSDPLFYSQALGLLEETGKDVLSFGYKIVAEDCSSCSIGGQKHRDSNQDVNSKELLASIALYEPYDIQGYVWNKIYKRSASRFKFIECLSSYEDLIWNLVLAVQGFTFLPTAMIGYEYRYNPTSLTRAKDPLKNMRKDYQSILSTNIILSLFHDLSMGKRYEDKLNRRKHLAAFDFFKHSIRLKEANSILYGLRTLIRSLSCKRAYREIAVFIDATESESIPIASMCSLFLSSKVNWEAYIISSEATSEAMKEECIALFGFTKRFSVIATDSIPAIIEKHGRKAIFMSDNAIIGQNTLERLAALPSRAYQNMKNIKIDNTSILLTSNIVSTADSYSRIPESFKYTDDDFRRI